MYDNYIKTGKDEITLPTFILIYEKEEWTDLTCINNIKPYYMISTYGRIYSKLNNKFINPRIMGHGYYIVTLMLDNGNIDLLVHRLVKMQFTPVQNQDSLQVNHIDGNSLNNYIYNLEWCNNEYNNRHKYFMNKARIHDYLLGYNVPINEQELLAINICKLLSSNKSYNEISNIINGYYDKNFIDNYVRPIKLKQNWKYISDFFNVNLKDNMRCSFTNEQIHNLCKMFQEGKSNVECLELLNLNNENRRSYLVTIGKIRRRERYYQITSQYKW